MDKLLFPVILAFVGLAIGIPSYITWVKRWPGMIAGFDPTKCTDVRGLTSWVGATGVVLAGAFLFAAGVVWVSPQTTRVVSVIIAVAGLIGVGVTMRGCSRFTRR